MGSWLSKEPKKMKKSKQNLILFFEENDDIKDISSNLVRFYMNRSVIDEEDQTEISDVYLLSKRDENAQIIEFYRENGKFHQLHRTGKDLGDMQKSMDKLENDKTTFELSVSKIIESERARLRDLKQNWYREWIDEGGLENWSDGKSGLSYLEWFKVKLAESDDQYINHFLIGTSFYINSSKPLQNFCKDFIQSCFQQAASIVNYKRDHEKKDFREATDSIESSTMMTVWRGTSSSFLTAAQVKPIKLKLKTGELEDFYKDILTATEPFSNDEFQTFDFCKLLKESELKKLKFQQSNVEYQYTQCERHSFPISSLKNSVRDNCQFEKYFLSFDEHDGQINSRVVRQCVNQFVIAEEDQVEVTGFNTIDNWAPCQVTFCLRDYGLLSKLKFNLKLKEILARKEIQPQNRKRKHTETIDKLMEQLSLELGTECSIQRKRNYI